VSEQYSINIKILGKTVSNQLRYVTTYLILLFTTKSKDTVHACMDGLGCFYLQYCKKKAKKISAKNYLTEKKLSRPI